LHFADFLANYVISEVRLEYATGKVELRLLNGVPERDQGGVL
jgi:hypothetical protein